MSLTLVGTRRCTAAHLPRVLLLRMPWALPPDLRIGRHLQGLVLCSDARCRTLPPRSVARSVAISCLCKLASERRVKVVDHLGNDFGVAVRVWGSALGENKKTTSNTHVTIRTSRTTLICRTILTIIGLTLVRHVGFWRIVVRVVRVARVIRRERVVGTLPA